MNKMMKAIAIIEKIKIQNAKVNDDPAATVLALSEVRKNLRSMNMDVSYVDHLLGKDEEEK